MHHSKTDVVRFYFPRKEGGRGMIELKLSYKTSTIGQHIYLTTTNRLDTTTSSHTGQNKKSSRSISKQSYKFKQ